MIPLLTLLLGVALADDPAPTDPTPDPSEGDSAPSEQKEDPPETSEDPGLPSEDEMFGAAPTPSAAPAAPSGYDDTEIQRLTNADIANTISVADDRVEIGGQIWLQFQGSLAEEGKLAEMPLSSPSFADVYADARPNERIRGYLRLRYINDFTIASTDTDTLGRARVAQTIALDQFWLKFDGWKRVFFTVGKQRIRWGTGRFWNPTDFMQTQRLDGLAVFDARLGVPLVKVHVPIEKTGTNLYALANVDAANAPDEIGVGFRVEQVIGSCEISASTLLRSEHPYKVGADFSGPVGPFDLKLEGALTRGTDAAKPHWEGGFSATETPTDAGWGDRWIPQLVAATELSIRYSDEDSFTIGAEYFYNGAGYANSDLYPWLLFNGQFTAFYLGQHYVGAYAFAANPGRLRNTSFTASLLGNLSDESYILRGDWRVAANTFLNLNTWAMGHFGGNGEFHYGLEVPPIPTIPGLEEGLDLAAPMIDVGFGAQITF